MANANTMEAPALTDEEHSKDEFFRRLAVVGEDMQGVHAEDDLLQRPAGQAADHQQVQLVQGLAFGAPDADLAVIGDLGAQPGGGDGDHLVPAPAQRIDQPPGMPRAGGAEDPGPKPLGHD